MNEIWTRLTSIWDNLSPRERYLVAGAGGSLALAILILGIIMPLINTLTDHSRMEAAHQQMQVMRRLAREYNQVNEKLSAVETSIQRNTGNKNLRTLLSSLASSASVEPTSMEMRPAAESDRYEETKVEVVLQKVTLEQAVKYLHSIESSDRVLSIKSLRVRRRPDKARLLDVTFLVSSFNPV